MPRRSSPAGFASKVELSVPQPFRLDLTVAALRRLSTNVVDVQMDDGRYVRAFGDAARGALLDVRATAIGLEAVVTGSLELDAPALVERMLGTRADLQPFYASASGIAWLDALARRMRGVRPPRYPSMWEAIVNAVVFQQVSIHAASAILRRTIEHLEVPVRSEGIALYAFPEPRRFIDADAEALRAAGLSVNKVVALKALARSVDAGDLRESELEPFDTPSLVERLVAHRGIGPWTAAVIALRGFGRLDTFPMRDSGVARSLRDLSGDPDLDAAPILERLGAQRGMLYYHLLLGRLAARGEIDA